jgi:hypothetical protein
MDLIDFTQFTRNPFVTKTGVLTQEAARVLLNALMPRVGGQTGTIYANSITNTPAGDIAADDVQSALNELDTDKQPRDATLTAIAGLTIAANDVIYGTGADAVGKLTLDTDGTLAANSDTRLATQKAVKTYADSVVSGAGAVVGPASSTNNNVAVFNGVTGKLLKDGGKALPSGDVVGTTDTQTLSGKTYEGDSLTVTGVVLSSGGGVGYTTGAGGTVTQATNKATGVTLDELCGEITMNGAALAAATAVSFTLTNSTIAAGDRLVLNHASAGTFGAYHIDGRSAAGSADIVVRNLTAGSLSEAIVIGFAVIKAVTA